jgi:D-alanyl-D-alanine dipeptidase
VGRVRIVAVVAAVVLGASACSGNPAPSAPPATKASPGSAAPPATASPSPGVPIDRKAPPNFVDLSHVDPTILLDIRYATPHNFVGRPVSGYLEPRCLVTKETAEALKRAQTAARAEGYSLKMYDCYRPERAGEDFLGWAQTPTDQTTKGEFYPAEPKDQLFADGYVGGARTSHSRGTAVDLTLVKLPAAGQPAYVPGQPLVPCTAPAGTRFADNSIDMGTGFDCFDSLAHTDDPRVSPTAHANRALLRRFMTGAGFVNYVNEWWHYDLNGGDPNAYYDFPVADGALQ